MDLFNFEALDIWRLLAGLGIFLFGMFLLEEGIHTLSGRAFQRMLRRFTDKPIKAVLTGTTATAVLQSSSAVSLMVLAFVGAGVLAMSNAIGVIIGSNLGTTFTAWIVATVGFKLDIEAFALPFIGIGGLGLIFLGKNRKYAAICRLLTGFGFLFMGLEYMKVAVSTYTESVGSDFFEGIHPLLFLLFGFLLTAVTQSSSASLAIILSAVHAGIADLFPAALFVIGANIGTTITVMLGSVGSSISKKRVASSHFLFNWITGIVTFLLLPVLLRLVDFMLYASDDPVTEVALFHTVFNLLGVLLFLPFTGKLGDWVIRLYPDKTDENTRYISDVPAKVGEAGAEALRKEAWHLIYQVMLYHNKVLHTDISPFSPLKKLQEQKQPAVHYGVLKIISDKMHRFAEDLQEESLSEEQSTKVNHALFAARMALFSAKWMKDLKEDLTEFEAGSKAGAVLRQELQKRQGLLHHQLEDCFATLHLNKIPYNELKNTLKYEDRIYVEKITRDNSGQFHKDGIGLAKQLTINKTWYLGWRNLLLAMRELDADAEETEPEDSL